MKYRIIPLAVLSLSGFACTLIAGIALERLNASTDTVSGWQYFISVALPVFGSLCAAAVRFVIRLRSRSASVSPVGSAAQRKTLTAIAAQINKVASSGYTDKARDLLAAIDIVTGAKSTP